MKIFILMSFILFCFSQAFGREVQYVRTTNAKAINGLTKIQFEMKLESFNSEQGQYLARLKLPSAKWIQPRNFKTFVQIPNLKVQRVPATVLGCTGLVCSISINYPIRGLVKLSAFIEWSAKSMALVQLPIESIISPNGDQKYVFIHQNGKSLKKIINLIRLNGVFGVTEDVSLADEVIIFGQERLVDGEVVEVIND